MNTRRSWESYVRAKRLIPGGGSSNAQCYPTYEPYPLTFKKGIGSKIWDADNNVYVDYLVSHFSGYLLLATRETAKSAELQFIMSGKRHSGEPEIQVISQSLLRLNVLTVTEC